MCGGRYKRCNGMLTTEHAHSLQRIPPCPFHKHTFSNSSWLLHRVRLSGLLRRGRGLLLLLGLGSGLRGDDGLRRGGGSCRGGEARAGVERGRAGAKVERPSIWVQLGLLRLVHNLLLRLLLPGIRHGVHGTQWSRAQPSTRDQLDSVDMERQKQNCNGRHGAAIACISSLRHRGRHGSSGAGDYSARDLAVARLLR